MEYFFEGSSEATIDSTQAASLVDKMLDQLGPMNRVLLLPPDFTRFHSGAGEITTLLYERLKGKTHVEIMPALGTHYCMTEEELTRMFPGIPLSLFHEHDWRNALVPMGEVPGDFISSVSEGKVKYSIQCAINKLLVQGNWDRIISIGQLVPHEIVGIANHCKNIFVGVGGRETIDKSHFLGSVYGLERMMGRAQTPVRKVFNYMATNFTSQLPISYVLLVRARNCDGKIVTRGMYGGDDEACFYRGARLCQQVNVDLLQKPLKKVVVYLDPEEFKSTWLGNKSIYRTRMAIADGGELVVLAPGVSTFAEDKEINKRVRKYGYKGTPYILENVEKNEDLAADLSAASHLIVGSSEGRFRVTYCTGGLTKEDVESVGYQYADCKKMMERYDPAKLQDGINRMPDGEEIFYVSNPALGLWSIADRFAEDDQEEKAG